MVIINFETNNIIVCENLLFSFKILLTLKFPAERVKVYNIMGSVRCVPFPLEKKREIKKIGPFTRCDVSSIGVHENN